MIGYTHPGKHRKKVVAALLTGGTAGALHLTQSRTGASSPVATTASRPRQPAGWASGPYVRGRCIDLSRAAFRVIAPLSLDEIDVRYELLEN